MAMCECCWKVKETHLYDDEELCHDCHNNITKLRIQMKYESQK